MKLARFAVATAALCTTLASQAGILPGSQPYRPLPKFEAGFFKDARRDVFPQQVRDEPDTYKDTLVAWTGVIVAIDYKGEGAERSVRITAEHHYFDWVEDSGIQKARYFLSPRGDGRFAAYWGVGTPDDQGFVDQFAVGDMLVAYGRPGFVRPEFIGLQTVNMRAIKPAWFRTDVLDYGKPGEPVTTLKTPF